MTYLASLALRPQLGELLLQRGHLPDVLLVEGALARLAVFAHRLAGVRQGNLEETTLACEKEPKDVRLCGPQLDYRFTK